MNKQPSSQSVLLIIDMIEGFVNEGSLSDPFIRTIIPSIRRSMDYFTSLGFPMIAINDHHHLDSQEFKAFPIHCLDGSSESVMLEPLQDDQLMIIKKNSVNAFMSPQFQTWFQNAPIYERYVICGCVSDICILHFALSLNSYFHEHDIDTQVVVISDAIATYHTLDHDRETYHQSAINIMKQVGIHLIESKSL